jgi:TPR repeat protein
MKNMDGQALRDMGYRFHNNGDYSKAMVLYQHAVFQNYSGAYNNIGALYDHGQGVAQDYLTAMEYFLNAARDNHTLALSNIGLNILKGRGVPADKYKALEWLTKSGNKPDEIKELNQQGIQLEEKDKSESFNKFELYLLIN